MSENTLLRSKWAKLLHCVLAVSNMILSLSSSCMLNTRCKRHLGWRTQTAWANFMQCVTVFGYNKGRSLFSYELKTIYLVAA